MAAGAVNESSAAICTGHTSCKDKLGKNNTGCLQPATRCGQCCWSFECKGLRALESGAVGTILRVLALDTAANVRSSALYALGCLVRRFPLAQRQFVDQGGLAVLVSLFDGDSGEQLKLQVKVVTFIDDLIVERQDAKMTQLEVLSNNETSAEKKEAEERLKQYKQGFVCCINPYNVTDAVWRIDKLSPNGKDAYGASTQNCVCSKFKFLLNPINVTNGMRQPCVWVIDLCQASKYSCRVTLFETIDAVSRHSPRHTAQTPYSARAFVCSLASGIVIGIVVAVILSFSRIPITTGHAASLISRGKTRKYNKATHQLNGRRDSAITLSTRPLDFDLCLRMGRGLR
ncbi:nucleotide exchange factor sil1 [Homalodisca vitripennis]|nr:nucleotide exchange factor sil1 [Homalodisca vitripennis]